MTFRNQNKPPAPRSPANKNRVVEDAPLDKRRKVGTGSMMASTSSSRGRRIFTPVNTQKDVAVAPSETEGSECESIEFTKEEVDALLNERFKGKKFDSKGKQEWMKEYQKKLKVCIKWYQKGLEDLVEEKNNLCKMLDSSERKCVEAEAAMKVKEEELNDSRDDAMKQKEAAVKEVDILRGELQQFRESREQQLLLVRAIKSELERYREDTLRTIDDLRMKSTALEETCSSQQEQISVLQHELAAANHKLKMADLLSSEYEEKKRRVFELQEQISVLQHELAAANHKLKMADLLSSEYEEKKRRVFELQAQLLEGERLRKKLHNTILELKGNIRVFCRVRPLLSDDVRGAEPTVCYPTSVESAGRGIDLIQSGQKYPFTFDKVFADDASQEEVFMEISQLVQSALDGYKVCIFAYGQTGSGKTYTMMGRPEAPQQKGLIPRSLEHVFQTSQALAAQGWKYKMQASMLEIYNETIRDLLSVRSSSGDVSRAEVGGAGKQYTIRHDADGNTYVSDLTIVDVCSIKEVLNLLQQAAHSSTLSNE